MPDEKFSIVLPGSRLLGLLSYVDSFICYRSEVKNGPWLSDPGGDHPHRRAWVGAERQLFGSFKLV